MERCSELTFLPRGGAGAVAAWAQQSTGTWASSVITLFLSHSLPSPDDYKRFLPLCFMYNQPGSLKACASSCTCVDSTGHVFTWDLFLSWVRKLPCTWLIRLTTVRAYPQIAQELGTLSVSRSRSGVLRLNTAGDRPACLASWKSSCAGPRGLRGRRSLMKKGCLWSWETSQPGGLRLPQVWGPEHGGPTLWKNRLSR